MTRSPLILTLELYISADVPKKPPFLQRIQIRPCKKKASGFLKLLMTCPDKANQINALGKRWPFQVPKPGRRVVKTGHFSGTWVK